MELEILEAVGSTALSWLNIGDIVQHHFKEVDLSNDQDIYRRLVAALEEVLLVESTTLAQPLITFYGNKLFAENPDMSYGCAMDSARRRVFEFLKSENIDRFIAVLFKHRECLAKMWQHSWELASKSAAEIKIPLLRHTLADTFEIISETEVEA